MSDEAGNKPSQAEGDDGSTEDTEDNGRFVLPVDDKPSQAEGDDDGSI
jgi:hypothetical protein